MPTKIQILAMTQAAVYCCLFIVMLIVSFGGATAPLYLESTEFIYNPERGHSFGGGGTIRAEGTQIFWGEDALKNDIIKYNVGYVGLRFGLEEFSSNGPITTGDGTLNGVEGTVVTKSGTDRLITESAINNVRNVLQSCRNVGQVAVIAFSYNVHGKSALITKNGNTYSTYVEAEPEAGMDLVIQHIDQLAEIVTEYSDVIMAVETRMLGPWGEQHSTPMANEKENYYHITKAWLDGTPDDVSILLRRPSYFLEWFNREYNHNITESNITDTIPLIESYDGDAKRVGLYNDGYLGSDSDLGTFHQYNRDKINEWLNYQAAHTFYGGEFSGNIPSITDPYQKSFSDFENVESEAFTNHVSFINGVGNYGPMAQWKSNIYNGPDEVYNGKTTQWEYYTNHLGYRYVLKDFKQSKSRYSLNINFEIENVGFGNLIKEKQTEIVLVDKNGNEIIIPTEIDMRELKSLEKNKYSLDLNLNEYGIEKWNSYTVYLRIKQVLKGEGATRAIAFANNNIYNSDLYANKLGTVII